ncbi:DegT/DnrJ/EryC1/StrS family aminotransferase [Arthrobacter sp. NPDC057009]|uniref:DegT/DnrJ/EryC1/StrS family aminotransferase n=1 Tax=Arthrobacter sp. NPDC057009 TaxID=3345996 RepID=UPI0036318BD3
MSSMIATKTASQPNTLLQPSFFYKSARQGMRDLLANTLTSPKEGVLLPAFIGWSQREGSGVFDPVLDSKAMSGFYNLHPDLSADVTDIERQLESGQYRVAVVIHYFGRTDPNIASVRALADRHNVILVEDLAHGFFSSLEKGPAGNFGHVSLFSLHKMFPLSEGGMIRYADRRLIVSQASTRPDLAEQVMSYDWTAISQARRSNFIALSRLLAAMPECGSRFEMLWPALEDHDVPQSLPVRIMSGNRDGVYDGMNRDGFGMVSLYHTLIEPVRDDFLYLNQLSGEITNFPVHQDVPEASIPAMVASFRHHLNSV